MPSPLRHFSSEQLHSTSASSTNTVGVRLGDLLPLLIEATKNRHCWVEDFSDDSVAIPHDLYEVMVAYQQQQARAA